MSDFLSHVEMGGRGLRAINTICIAHEIKKILQTNPKSAFAAVLVGRGSAPIGHSCMLRVLVLDKRALQLTLQL